jgi:hypothetical protein
LFFFDWPLPGFIGLLGVLPVSLLARIIAWIFLAHRLAPPVVCSDNGFSAPPSGTTPLGTAATGFFMSTIPVRPRPTKTSATTAAMAAQMASALFILGLHCDFRNNSSKRGLFREPGMLQQVEMGRNSEAATAPVSV